MTDLTATTGCCGGEPASTCGAGAATKGGRFRITGRLPWLWLGLVVVLYISMDIYGLLGSDTADPAAGAAGLEILREGTGGVLDAIARMILASGAVLQELLPFWIIGMLIAGVLISISSSRRLQQRIRRGGLRGSTTAAAFGSLVPICSCSVAPLMAGMTRARMPLGPAIAFLIAAPMLNLPAVFMTGAVLGWPLAAARIVGTLTLAVFIALLLERWARGRDSLEGFLQPAALPDTRPTQNECCGDGEENSAQPPGFALRCTEALAAAWRMFMQMNRYLILAVFIAGAIKVLLPAALVSQWLGGEGLLSVIIAAGAASLLYMCTYAEIPTAMALMEQGMGPGAALAYLLGGPGLSLPGLAILAGVFRIRALLVYAVLSLAGCVLAGVLFNLLLIVLST